MKKRFLLLLLLLFALYGLLFAVPDIIKHGADGPLSELPSSDVSAETMEDKTFPYETAWGESETESEPTSEAEPPKDGPGEPVDREKIVTNLIFASDIHYMSPELTDYGNAFYELIDNGDGKVMQYVPQIWQAFSEEVIAARPDALILSGDLTINGEKINHQEFTAQLAQVEAAGIPVFAIPGNHDINNPYATAYYGNEQSFIETVTPQEFRALYGAYGYDEAVSHAPDSLSYLSVLNETTWLLMLDSCIYDPVNEVDGEIKSETLIWMEQCFKDAYAQGITVIPVAHHNFQELSRVHVEECVLRNHEEVIQLLETYLTPVCFSGHLHVQRIQKHTKGPGAPEELYGMWEIVSNSLTIPPCQYGRLTLHADGTMTYETHNTDIQAWAARHGETNPELLDFTAFSESYIRTVISRQIFHEIDDIPDEMKETMAAFYADLYRDYYAGVPIDEVQRKREEGYFLWERYLNASVQLRQIEGMMRDSMAVNNRAQIPYPVHMLRE